MIDIEFLEDEQNEYIYDNEMQIDLAIQRIKDNQTEKARLQEIYDRRVEQLKFDLDSKLSKLDKRIEWDTYNVGQVVKNATDKRETKTTWKKDYLSGQVVIKKETQKMTKPNVDEETIKTQFADYAKPKVELNWAEMKKHCEIKDGKVYNTVTGEDLTKYIEIEIVPEKVEIK